VKHNLEMLSNAIGDAVVKAITNSKDEIIGINLHAQQLANFHNATADIDKLVNLLTSVEKVLLEVTLIFVFQCLVFKIKNAITVVSFMFLSNFVT
jgi:hypothetical protein